VCVVDYPASSVRWVVFHKVVRQHNSGEVSEFTIFWREIFSGFCKPKLIEIGSFFAELFKLNKGTGVFLYTVYTDWPLSENRNAVQQETTAYCSEPARAFPSTHSRRRHPEPQLPSSSPWRRKARRCLCARQEAPATRSVPTGYCEKQFDFQYVNNMHL